MSNLPADQGTKEVEKLIIARIIELELAGTKEYKMPAMLEEQFGQKFTRYRVRNYRNSAEFKGQLEDLSRETKGRAASKFLSKIDQLADKAYLALEHLLDEKKAEGVRIFAEIAGLKGKDEEKVSQQPLQVFLPGAHPETVIDITPEPSGGET